MPNTAPCSLIPRYQREDVLMIVMCNVVGVNMPFPMLFRMKFRFTNRQLLINAALMIAVCNILIMYTQSVVLMCVLAYIAGLPQRFHATYPCAHVAAVGNCKW